MAAAKSQGEAGYISPSPSLNTAISSAVMSRQQHPIHHLALEVLQEIFIQCLPPVPIHPNTSEAPLLLCRICSSWRNIAINMPELWQSLSIAPSFRSDPSDDVYNPTDLTARRDVVYEHYTSLVNGWFSRTKEQPLLSLQFWLDIQPDSGELQLANSRSLISDVLVANAERFRYLDVGTDRAENLQRFFTPIPRPDSTGTPGLTHLESLVLRLPDLPDLNPGTVTAFRSAPKLRRVGLQTLTVDWPFLFLWSNLTHLRITEFLIPHTWIALLGECTSLQNGVFCIRTVDTPPATAPPSEAAHSKLSNLQITFLGDLDGVIFRTLCPSAPLKTLKLNSFIGGSRHISQLASPLFANLRHLMHSLTTFRLIMFDIEVNELLDLLRISSNLVRFEFAGSGRFDYEALFKCMRWVGSNGGTGGNGNEEVEVLLPKLEELYVHVPTLEEVMVFPTTSFVDMIKSRRDVRLSFTESTAISLSCLSHLTFSIRDENVLEEVEQTLSPCCRDGLVGTFNLIKVRRWGVSNRYNGLEHW